VGLLIGRSSLRPSAPRSPRLAHLFWETRGRWAQCAEGRTTAQREFAASVAEIVDGRKPHDRGVNGPKKRPTGGKKRWAVGDLRKNLRQASIPIPEFRNQAILSGLAATGSVGE